MPIQGDHHEGTNDRTKQFRAEPNDIMKAVSFYHSLPINEPQSLVDVVVAPPKPRPRDLLVQVRAISVNRVDTKIRAGGGPGRPAGELQILGWDAAGIVQETETR